MTPIETANAIRKMIPFMQQEPGTNELLYDLVDSYLDLEKRMQAALEVAQSARSLANEVDGLNIERNLIKAGIGETNWNCLQQRKSQVLEALHKFESANG